MRFTNKKGLPSAFVNLAQDDSHPRKDGQYSATTILNPTRQVLLQRRHEDEIEVDVADMVWMVFGTAVHKVLEEHDDSGYSEVSLETEVMKGVTLTGRADLYNEEEFALEDYKTSSVWKVIYEDFEEYRKQGLIYAWLLEQEGKPVQELRFHILLKDWSAGKKKLADKKDDFYPDSPIWTWTHTIRSHEMKEIEVFIKERLTELVENENIPDDQLPLCTQEERWNPGSKWAVKVKNRKRAKRVFDTREEAQDYIHAMKDDKLYIEERPGEDRRCLDYCFAAPFCSYYKKYYGGDE